MKNYFEISGKLDFNCRLITTEFLSDFLKGCYEIQDLFSLICGEGNARNECFFRPLNLKLVELLDCQRPKLNFNLS